MTNTGILGSGSSLSRTLECPLSEQLPHEEDRSLAREIAAERGTQWHTFAEHLGTPHAFSLVDQKYHEEFSALDISSLAGYYTTDYLREVKFKYDLRTGRVERLPFKGHRDYGEVEPHELTCTLDVVTVGFHTLEVWDYKTGGDPRSFQPINTNPQLLFGAVCALKTLAPHATTILLGVQHAPSRKRKFIVQPKAYVETVDPLDLWAFEEKLGLAYERALEVQESLTAGIQVANPGPVQCKWCPAKKACEAYDAE